MAITPGRVDLCRVCRRLSPGSHFTTRITAERDHGTSDRSFMNGRLNAIIPHPLLRRKGFQHWLSISKRLIARFLVAEKRKLNFQESYPTTRKSYPPPAVLCSIVREIYNGSVSNSSCSVAMHQKTVFLLLTYSEGLIYIKRTIWYDRTIRKL